MNNPNLLVRSLMWMSSIFIFAYCEKQEDEKDEYNKLFGTHTIEGVILYRDARTNVLDTAGGAVVELNRNEADSTKFKARKDLSLSAKGGLYKFTQLPNGKYRLNINYINNNISYNSITSINTENSSQINSAKTIILTVNKSIDYGVASLSGYVKIDEDISSDENQLILAPDAQLILTGPTEAALDQTKDTTKTDDEGIYKFKNLNAGSYVLEAKFQQQQGNIIFNYTHSLNVKIGNNADSTKNIILTDNSSSQANINFKVLFTDITTDLNRIASGANVEVQMANTIRSYITDANGKFKIDKPLEETYQITANLRQEIGEQMFHYTAESEITIEKEKSDYEIDLTFDKQALINPLLKIMVFDQNDIRMSNSRIFLYGSESSRNNDTERVAAIFKDTTNTRGILLLNNIDKRKYYLYSKVIIGNDTISSTDTINWSQSTKYADKKIILK